MIFRNTFGETIGVASVRRAGWEERERESGDEIKSWGGGKEVGETVLLVKKVGWMRYRCLRFFLNGRPSQLHALNSHLNEGVRDPPAAKKTST